MALYSDFCRENKYRRSLTVKFELKPIGKTKQHIDNKGIIKKDLQRSLDAKSVKQILDEVYRNVLDECLESIPSIDWELLSRSDRDSIKKNQDDIRKQIVDSFKKYKKTITVNKDENEVEEIEINYKSLFKKSIFNLAVHMLKSSTDVTYNEKIELLKNFEKFTSYFTKYFETRKNIFSDEAKSSAATYRIVNENFSKFFANCEVYAILKQKFEPLVYCLKDCLYQSELIKNRDELDTIFTVSNYSKYLSQKGINKINEIIGGKPAAEGRAKVQGINEILNLQMQKDPNLREKLKSSKVSRMTFLYKQVLSDQEKNFKIDCFNEDDEVIKAVQVYFKSLDNTIGLTSNSSNPLLLLIKNLCCYDMNKVYIGGNQLHYLSALIYGSSNHSYISERIIEYFAARKAQSKFEKSLLKAEDKNQLLLKQSFSIRFLSDLLDHDSEKDNDNQLTLTDEIIKRIQDKFDNIISLFAEFRVKSLKSNEEKESLKTLLDSVLDLNHLLKIFQTDNIDQDRDFYFVYDELLSEISKILPLYNMVRSYCTKKPYSYDKFKLNFESPQLAGGWSKSKENDYMSIILIQNDNYYLGIMNKDDKPNLNYHSKRCDDCDFKKVDYYLFKDISKMLPKCTFTKEVIDFFKDSNNLSFTHKKGKTFCKDLKITREIYDIYINKKYQITNESTGDNKDSLFKWIDFAKDFLRSYISTTNFDYSSLKSTNSYFNLKQFYDEVDNISYKIQYSYINQQDVMNSVENGKLYLFQIYSKDFSAKSTGKKNLHTLYFNSLFSEYNNEKRIIKLDGGAELFFRQRSIVCGQSSYFEHAANSLLVNKTYEDGSGKIVSVSDRIYQEISDYICGKSDSLRGETEEIYNKLNKKNAQHTIIKNKRFTEDKFFFHCPITINYRAQDKIIKFNDRVLEFLKNNPDINIIGIDRGERNLLYVAVIDQKGNLLDSHSFNSVPCTSALGSFEVDFESKLRYREQQRDIQRKNWNTISKISNLKEGYLSGVIHEITKMMIKYNAIIVMENLNTGFKRVRGGLSEKSVYQKFEKQLISKLNYLCFKNTPMNDFGSIINGYQLTDAFTSFKDLGQQSGFIFYVPAQYTSKIDPTTGFINLIDFSRYKNHESKKEILSAFHSICYDEEMFVFDCDMSKFKLHQNSYINEWKIYTFGERIIKVKNNVGKWSDKTINLTEEFKKLFTSFDISYSNGNICELLQKIDDKDFWSSFVNLFKYTVQLRNSKTSDNSYDRILSPVKNSYGCFYDSSSCSKDLPQDADANGAYHIALKGALLLKHINSDNSNRLNSLLYIANNEWINFVQSRNKK